MKTLLIIPRTTTNKITPKFIVKERGYLCVFLCVSLEDNNSVNKYK